MDPFSDIKNWSDVKQIENFLKTHIVNTRDEYGYSILHRVIVESGHTEVVKMLIEHGADVNAENNWKYRPLDKALLNRRTENIKILLNSPEINLNEYSYIEGVKEILIKRPQNMINKLKIIQTACVGPEILEFIGGYLYPDISVHERLDIINEI